MRGLTLAQKERQMARRARIYTENHPPLPSSALRERAEYYRAAADACAGPAWRVLRYIRFAEECEAAAYAAADREAAV